MGTFPGTPSTPGSTPRSAWPTRRWTHPTSPPSPA